MRNAQISRFASGDQGEVLGESWISTSEILILGREGDFLGTLPPGVVLYSVADPWGDKTLRYKIYLQSLSGEELPLVAAQRLRTGEKVISWLKPLTWLNDSNGLRLSIPPAACTESSGSAKE